jgi:hypothetical protein
MKCNRCANYACLHMERLLDFFNNDEEGSFHLQDIYDSMRFMPRVDQNMGACNVELDANLSTSNPPMQSVSKHKIPMDYDVQLSSASHRRAKCGEFV